MPQVVPTPNAHEVGPLAGELATAFRDMVDSYKEVYRLTHQEAVAKAEERPPAEYLDRVLHGPPKEVTWYDLHSLGEQDPARALARWEEIKKAARDELQSGYRAAAALEGFHNCWDRAQFLAIRQDLLDGWQPRNGVERQLIDVMAQAQTEVFFWTQQLTLRSVCEALRPQTQQQKGRWEPPRLSEAEAVEQAAQMIDRFNKVFLRTLRALRDLRRYTPAVVIQNAGQVNVGHQQVNVQNG